MNRDMTNCCFLLESGSFFIQIMHFEGVNLDVLQICEYNEVLNYGFS